MAKLGDLYKDFSRIDLDTRGGYARVVRARTLGQSGNPEFCAFKIMRHEVESQKKMERFEGELDILIKITQNAGFPAPITPIFDSGFVDARVSKSIQKPKSVVENPHTIEKINPELGIISTGTDLQTFLKTKASLDTTHWLPYLAVELAPYDNSLLRQIRWQSPETALNPFFFSANEIVDMAQQLLTVMKYLHDEHGLAYMDWKPEHVYWDSSNRQVKLIDWNVTSILSSGLERRRTIREDIRLFCGAVLYCSVALNDPEDMKRPIGPEPRLGSSSSSWLQRRYWTDDPEFYERGVLFDDRIKQIIKTGLDPNQGFNSIDELQDMLSEYAEQTFNALEFPESDTESLGVSNGIPLDAVQNFRRARSYIAAEDFEYAKIALNDAVDSARKKGVEYSDAEELLEIVKNQLAARAHKQNAKKAIESKDWESALDLYFKAFKLDSNILTSSEARDIQSVLLAKADDLENKGLGKFFVNTNQVKVIAESLRSLVTSDTAIDATALKSIDRQLSQIKFARSFTLFAVTISVVVLIFTSVIIPRFIIPLAPASTATYTVTPTSRIIATDASEITPTFSEPITPTITSTATLQPTETPTPTSTETILGVGFINKVIVSVWEEPNAGLLGQLKIRQPLTLIEQRVVSGSIWFKCRWELGGTTNEGWVLGEYITFGAPPTPAP
ncbi:MAG TPA: hypothetical protein DCX54_02055 [Flavobacteriales bacterium]|nr:hypothetical protein [Flavobacteriales bacterium]